MALGNVSKTYNTDNKRKAQASVDLLYLSWAQMFEEHKDETGGLVGLMMSEEHGLSKEEAEATTAALEHTFKVLKPTEGQPVLAKDFRKAMRDQIKSMLASERNKKERKQHLMHCLLIVALDSEGLRRHTTVATSRPCFLDYMQ